MVNRLTLFNIFAVVIGILSHLFFPGYVYFLDLISFYLFLSLIFISEFSKNRHQKISLDLEVFLKYAMFFVILPIITLTITVLSLSGLINYYAIYFYIISTFFLLYIYNIDNKNAYFSFLLSLIFSIGKRTLAYYLVLPYLIQFKNLKIKKDDKLILGIVFLVLYVIIIFAQVSTGLSNIISSYIHFIILVSISLLLNKEVFTILRENLPIIFSGIVSFLLLVIKNDIVSVGLVVLSIILYVLLKWDERIPIGYAILYLILAAIVLAKGNENFANDMAIVTYWNLCVGVIASLINYIRCENDNK